MATRHPSLIGVVHLEALTGSPRAPTLSPAEIVRLAGLRAIAEARAFAKAGFDGVILENFGDSPFWPTRVPPETIAAMSLIAAAVRESLSPSVALGVNVLRNDAFAALAIAATTGCQFIRVNVLSGVAATDQGWIEGQAHLLLRERERLRSEVAVFADVHVKHAVTYSGTSLKLAVEEALGRAQADAVIVTGNATGHAAQIEELHEAREAAGRAKLFVGSGVTSENVSEMLKFGGIIVGSDLRKSGRAGAELDGKRIARFAQAARKKR